MPQFPGTFNVASLNGSNGFKLTGETRPVGNDFWVASAGDVNGDGFDDIIIGDSNIEISNTDVGGAYVVFGKPAGFTATVDLTSLNGNDGFEILGQIAFSHTGGWVSSAGDINGDGFSDLIIGAAWGGTNGANAGASYVVFGKASGFGSVVSVASLNGSNGFQINGETEGDQAGYSVASAGDLNGDGFDDLIIGARFADPGGVFTGATYVVFGKASGFSASLELSSLNGSNGFEIDGANAFDYTGFSVASAGDVNKDGFDDIIIGASGADPHGNLSGAAYVVFGKAGGFGATLSLASLNGSNGFKISGALERDFAGTSVAAGDINGDGYSDIIVGAPGASGLSGDDEGATYIIWGKASGFPSNIDVTTLNGSNGFTIVASEVFSGSGGSVASADINNDGYDDIITGGWVVYGKGTSFGSSFVLSNLDGTTGFRITGIGFPSAAAGDVNGDGAEDLIFGGNYVVFGNNPSLQFSAAFQLSSLNGANGFQINGEAAGDISGFSVSSAGDVNNDGFDDLLIGARDASPNGLNSGASYVVFGKRFGFSPNVQLSGLNGTTGFQISGEVNGDHAGFSVGSAGDVNGDGFDDFLIGAPIAAQNGANSGASYVVFGKGSGFSANLDLSSLNGSNGFQITGRAVNDFNGYSVSSGGDVNGDGFADIIIGTPGAPDGSYFGKAYVILGKGSGFGATFDLASLNGSNGFEITGEAATDLSGFDVSSAGDVNGDGFADLLVGAPFQDPHGTNSGATYVVFGKASGFGANLNLSTLDGTNGFQINSAAGGDLSGWSVSSAGDFNGDGFSDLIIGAWQRPDGGKYAGTSFIVLGKASGFSANLDLIPFSGPANSFQIIGGPYSASGFSVSGAGDVNGDGFDDVIIGAYGSSPNGIQSGAAYVVYGNAAGIASRFYLEGFPPTIPSAIDGSTGFKINGEAAYDAAGFAVSRAGDINGDGFADLIIGAPGEDPNGSNSGASYVVFGRLPTTAVVRTGTNASQTLAGGNFNDALSGLGGNDILYGNGGNDTLNGGTGTDTAVFVGARSAYTIARTGAGFTITGPDGADALTDVEKAKFDDRTIVLGSRPPPSDFNNDFTSDLLWQDESGQPVEWLMNGTVLVSGGASGSNPGNLWHVKGAGDFNGDGFSDILWQNNDGTPVIWFMNGTTLLSGGIAGFNPGSAWHIVGAGDFNGDGKADILWQNADGTPAVWIMNGTNLVTGRAFGNPGAAWHVIGAGDFNGDGNSDILWQHDDGTAVVWLLNGIVFGGGGAVGSNPGSAWHVKAAADFNGDGKSDILWQNSDGTPVVWFMNGTSLTSGGVAGFNPGSSWKIVGAGDFNDDGKADISWQNTDGTPAIWLMNGTSLLSGASYVNPGSTWHVIAMGN